MNEKTTAENNRNHNAWKKLEQAITKHHHNPDLQAARIVFASVAAHYIGGQPVWPMLVAPPGSMKTELLNGMDSLPQIHFIDSITSKTFISGQLDDGLSGSSKQPASLLHRIGTSGMIVYPDFSTVLAMKRDDKAAILADMRRIFDGKLSKEFGTAENLPQRTWEGRITFVVAVTPEIDRHYSIFQSLGERFLMVRWPRAGGIEAALAAMNQNNKQAKLDIRAAVHSLLTTLPKVQPQMADDLQVRIAALREIAVRGRTHVPRSGYTKDIIYVPEPESSTRFAQQLCQLAKGSALLDGREEVNRDDLTLVRRAAFDSMPPARKQVFEALLAGKAPNSVKLPPSTLKYTLEDMTSQDLVTEKPHRLSELAHEMAVIAGIKVTGGGEPVAA